MSSPSGKSVTDADLRHVARLARLTIPDDQLHRFGDQLRSILTYVDRIGEVDVDGVAPMAHPIPIQNVLREDVAEAGLPIESVLQNTTESDGRFFKVPKIIGGEDDSAG